jgi:hypothetical protein
VEDAATGSKYPVYIALNRASSFRARKFRKENFDIGDTVPIKGKTRKLVTRTLAGTEMIIRLQSPFGATILLRGNSWGNHGLSEMRRGQS